MRAAATIVWQPARPVVRTTAAPRRGPLGAAKRPLPRQQLAARSNGKDAEWSEDQGREERPAPRYREDHGKEDTASTMAWVDEPCEDEPPEQREDEAQRSAGAQTAGGGLGAADKLEQAAAAPPPLSEAPGPSQAVLNPSMEELSKVLSKLLDEKLEGAVKKLDEKLEGAVKRLDALHKEVAAISRGTGANSQTLARMSFATIKLPGYWVGCRVVDADALLDLVSCAGWPADLAAVLDEVLAEHRGYRALLPLVLLKLAEQVPSISSLAAQFEHGNGPMHWEDELHRLEEVVAFLRQQEQEEGEDARWWAPFLHTLQVYCTVAAQESGGRPGGSDSLRHFLQSPTRGGRVPLVMLVAAVAASQLRTSLDFDGVPQLEVQGNMLSVAIMKAKTSIKGLSKACQQLQVAGQVVVWLLHIANPKLIAGRQLQLRGVVAVQEALPAAEWGDWEREVDASCPGVTAAMRLELWDF